MHNTVRKGEKTLMAKLYEELYLTTSDNIKIAINHYKKNTEQALIIAPGWTMSKDSKFITEIAKSFAKELDVISLDFRGHGKSAGAYTFTSKEFKDLAAIINYAKKHYEKVYLLGFSLGGATSIIFSAESKSIDKLITVSAPHSFKRIKHYMWVKDFIKNPFKKYEFKRWITVRPNLIIKEETKPIDVVGKILIPTLFIAGDSDTITSPCDTKSLFEKANCHKRFELFGNCNHAEDIIHQEKEKLIKICLEWLQEVH